MYGNAFRVLIDPKDKVGYGIQGRFDLHGVKMIEVQKEEKSVINQRLSQQLPSLVLGQCYKFKN